MGDVVPLWTDRRQAHVEAPQLLDDFLHHMRTFHSTDLTPQGKVGEPWTSPSHELRSHAEVLHREHHRYPGSYQSRVVPHEHG